MGPIVNQVIQPYKEKYMDCLFMGLLTCIVVVMASYLESLHHGRLCVNVCEHIYAHSHMYISVSRIHAGAYKQTQTRTSIPHIESVFQQRVRRG